ncbi:ferritin-like domain-containing protein [Spirosoma soli]|uniref:Ferritin-like domain-containing protein n=1 Tax=Spirosoma soli TaxID=1770529 RepID=A0ABW5LWE5_9BACT
MASLTDRISNFFSGNDSDTGEGLRSLFVTELQDIYYAERQAVDVLGVQADAATTDEVRSAFLQHQDESRSQIARLEQVFSSIGIDASEGTCDAIDGLADDGERVVANTESGSLTRDAGLIMAAQKVEHHEIASYGSVVTLAKVLGYNDAARLLQQTLEEEKNTDRKLTQLAESFINQRAASEGDDNNSTYTDSNRDQYGTVNADGTRYNDSGSVGQTYQSGQSYSGTQTSSNTDYNSGSVDSDDRSTTPRYNSNNDATLGGSLGI